MTVHVYVYENTETTLWFESLVVCEGGPWRLLREYDKEIPDPVGPGGTTDYNQLSNRPQINSVLLAGDKTSEQLNIKGNARITFDNEYKYLQIRDDNGTDIGFTQETANTVRVQEYAKDSRGQVQPIFDETLTSKKYVDDALTDKQDYVVIDVANFDMNTTEFTQLFFSKKLIYIKDGYQTRLITQKYTWDLLPEVEYELSYIENNITVTYQFEITDDVYYRGRHVKPNGNNFEVGVEKWYGTYRVDGVTYQVYSKLLDIGPLPSAAGVTNYPHGISGIKQMLQISGFTNDGFVMNAPRQNAQDNISIYQAQKSGNIAVEVGKDRSSKTGFVMLIYAKNN